jgi:demethylmenaquinone methyltransferase / 2-methoxy-6-polyprenyl-1,4-benzoquinol methylase
MQTPGEQSERPERLNFSSFLFRESILRALYRFYLHRCLPLLGSFLTKRKSAYDYRGDSVEEFPGGEALLRLMETNGFRDAIAEPITSGIVTIYTAEK